jgi:uncharacterized protein YjbI with pentapeptide repeats
MAEFVKQDFSGARFEQVDFSRAWFRNVYFTGATVRGAWLEDVDIDGEIRNVRINGVDIGPLVEAELNRRYPERTKLDPADADGFREAWAIIERAWPPTVERARRLPQDLLHERVEGEWSFIETLRHLVFATDAWVRRAILGHPEPYSPLGLPHDEMEPDPSVPTTPTRDPPWTRCSNCAPTACAPFTTSSRHSPTTWSAARPTRCRRRATRRRAATRYAAAYARLSTRSGCTACTPNATSPSSSSGWCWRWSGCQC